MVKLFSFLLVLCTIVEPEAAAQRPRLSRKPAAADDLDARPSTYQGQVLSYDSKSIMIDAVDHRILTFKIDRNTHTPSAAPRQGDTVKVVATQDAEAFLTAQDISVETAAAASASGASNGDATPEAKASAPVFYKPAKPDPDDEGPPRLRHGQPNPPPAKPLPPETESDAVVVPPSAERSLPADSVLRRDDAPGTPLKRDPALSPTAELIERAREWALSFTETLPNYVCQQFTTRYLKPPGVRDWQAKDVVSASVIYENGKEDYRNIAINGKIQSKKMEELPGSWSTGEFGTTLRSLFSPGRRALFKYVKQSQITGMTASVYDYSVKREYSDWRITLGGQAVIPAYSGRVWIDQKTARVIRIEMQADDIPKDFPLDHVESSSDYGMIRLAAADQFMLPLHAETLSCERNSTFCSRNAIEFRNYHKYTGEANITF